MKLTTKGRYAVTAMLDLALNSSVNPVSLAEISDRQVISLSYLEQLFAKLRKHDLVVSTRGPGGGYRVARNLNDIVVADIISAVDESVDATHCGGKKNCRSDGQNSGRCLTHDLWAELSERIEEFLGSVSLQDLIDRHPDDEFLGSAKSLGSAKPLLPGTQLRSELHPALQPDGQVSNSSP